MAKWQVDAEAENVVVQIWDYLMSLRGVSGPGEQELALAGEEQEKRSVIRAL